jgi:hypothetical protein
MRGKHLSKGNLEKIMGMDNSSQLEEALTLQLGTSPKKMDRY